MVNYKNQDNFYKESNKGEIIFANHKLEFLRFFESHKKLCDEISGLKRHTVNNIHHEEKIIINKKNFIIGINRLSAFVTDYFHYIDEEFQRREISERYNKLEAEFNNDTEYHSLVSKGDDVSVSQEVILTKLYLKYLIECFEIGHLVSKYLQKSLNIASKEILKTIHFVDYDGFYNNLSHYRDETVNDLSNIKYETIFENYKKLIGYFYTYRYLMNKDSDEVIKRTIMSIYEYITSAGTIKNIIWIKEGSELSNSKKQDIKVEFLVIRDLFNGIYILCNNNLKNKNILPKSKVDVLIDNTLI